MCERRCFWLTHLLFWCFSVLEIHAFRLAVNAPHHDWSSKSKESKEVSGLLTAAGPSLDPGDARDAKDSAEPRAQSRALAKMSDEIVAAPLPMRSSLPEPGLDEERVPGGHVRATPHFPRKDGWISKMHVKDISLRDQFDIGAMSVEDIGVNNLAAKDVALGTTGIGRVKLTDVQAQGLGLRGARASNISLQNFSIIGTDIANLNVKNIRTGGLAVSNMTVTKGSISNVDLSHVQAHDLRMHALDLTGDVDMSMVKLHRVASDDVHVNDTSLRNLEIHDVDATGIGARDVHVNDMTLRKAGFTNIGIHDVNGVGIGVGNFEANRFSLGNAHLSNADLSHIQTDGVRILGVDVTGNTSMQSVVLGKVALGDVAIGRFKNVGQEIFWYMQAAKHAVVFLMLLSSLMCIHLSFVVARDVKRVFEDKSPGPIRRETTWAAEYV